MDQHVPSATISQKNHFARLGKCQQIKSAQSYIKEGLGNPNRKRNNQKQEHTRTTVKPISMLKLREKSKSIKAK